MIKFWKIKPSVGLLSIPYSFVFIFFFFIPLVLTLIISFWDYNEYSIIPDVILENYSYIFKDCFNFEKDMCVTFKTYLSTFIVCFITWFFTLIIGFFVAYFLAFYVNSVTWQIALFLLCTIPFWTSNVIRMISWIPLLGRNGLVNDFLLSTGLADTPQEWLLYSGFSIVLAFVPVSYTHLTLPTKRIV